MGEEEQLLSHATAAANNDKDDNAREDHSRGRGRDVVSDEPGRQRHVWVGGKGMGNDVT